MSPQREDDRLQIYVNTIKSFCSDFLLEELVASQGFQLQPSATCVHGAVMLADISGFTRLSGTLCHQGQSGLDKLRMITSDFLSQIIFSVYSFGGDGKLVFLCLWR